MANLPERFEALRQWVETAGGQLHPSVEIYYDDLTKASFRVRSSASLAQGQDVIALPLSRSLSFLNAVAGHPGWARIALLPAIIRSADGDHLPSEFLAAAPPHVIGRFFLIQQYLARKDSPWWPYISTLPQPEHMADMLPIMWPSDDVEFLRATNAYIAVAEIRSTLRKEYKQAMKLLPANYQFEFTRPLYYWAYSIFTSRSFRPSLIIPDDQLQSLPCQPDDFSILLPLFDIGNHSPLAKTSWVTDSSTLTCTLRSEQGYSAGQQIYNNYGMKTNAELLLGYGFILPESDEFHNDYVHVKTKANPEAGDLNASHIVSLRSLSHPSSLVGRSRLLDPEHVDCIPPFSHLQDSLIAALFESITKGDDEGLDASLTDIMQGKIPESIQHQIIDALSAKLNIDLEELELNNPEYEPANRNQTLALLYREQCKNVLRNALTSLSD
ncbi:SET domain-containing protein [Xylariaceae sp. FL0255]|nr:SET domain-containing protein [Xylariaceae sp. FL0255]